MKFKKFGKALLMGAVSAGILFSVTSCVESYSVGYLYVTGTVTSTTNGSGIISGFKIDHNTGKLTPINGMPVASGGANPVRAVLVSASRFFYVLNQGVPQPGQTECTTEYPCTGSNIAQFMVGANGILTPVETFYTQGLNPFRMIADTTGGHIFVLEHDSQINNLASSATNPNPSCGAALSGATTCGDISVFTINSTTGRLTLVLDAQATTALGTPPLPYFPVPSAPIDFVLYGSYVYTLSGTPATGDAIFPYGYNSSNGVLSVVSNSVQPLSSSQTANGLVDNARAINYGASYVFVLDNEPITVDGSVASESQILPYGVGANGALTAANSGPIPDDANQSNPIYLVLENKGKWFYVANQGNNATGTGTSQSGITGYVVNNPFQPTEMAGSPVGFGTGGGPQCMVEDPSNQFFYTANFNDSTVTGQALDTVSGTLVPLANSTKVSSEYALTGPPTWCLVNGRTS
jgi:hypothetical protein